MTNEQLRALQNEFLQVMEDCGHFKRAGLSNPLFDKDSPTGIQVQRDLWPAYVSQFKEAISRWKPSTNVLKPRPAYYKHHRPCGSHEARLAEDEAGSEPVHSVHGPDSRREAGEEVCPVPITTRRLLKR